MLNTAMSSLCLHIGHAVHDVDEISLARVVRYHAEKLLQVGCNAPFLQIVMHQMMTHTLILNFWYLLC